MEEQTPNSTPQGYSKDDGFTGEGKKTIKTLDAITKSTIKANKELETYAETYKELNKQLQTLQKTGGIPNVPSKAIKPSVSPAGGFKSTPQTKQLDGLFKNIFGAKGETAFEALAKLSPKTFTGLSTELTSLTSVGSKAVPVIGAVVAVLSAMYAVGGKAYEQNMQLNRALMSMGARSSELTKSTSDAANAAIKAKSSWEIAGNNLSQAFEPVFAGFEKFLGWLGSGVADLTKGVNNKSGYTQGNSMARWYTAQMETNYKVPESASLPVISQTATAFGSSGMDPQSAANAAINTYDAAYKIALKYGEQSQEVAKVLSDAWLSGSNAAQKYGIVVNDNILAGFMASKGVDIVNTKITDASKQAYQYQLVMAEASARDSTAMRKQIADWNILGQKIADASQQLFSYDKVINIQGRDYSTPTISLDTGSPSDGGTGGTPVNPSGSTPIPNPVVKPVVDTEPIKQLENELSKIPNPYAVNVPVTVPGYEGVPALERELGRVPQRYPVNIPVAMPGYELIPNALRQILQIPQNYTVNIPISIPGLDMLREAVNLAQQLASSPYMSGSYAPSSMPSYAFAPMAVQRSLALTPATSPANVLSGNRVTSKIPATQHYSPTPKNLAAFANVLGVSQGQLNTAASFGGINGFDTMCKAYASGDMHMVNKYLGYASTATTASQFAAPAALALTGAVATGTVAVPAVTGLAAKASSFIGNAASSVGKAVSSYNPLGWLDGLMKAEPALATGGIGVKESLVRAFEGNKAEAIIPLETSHGQEMLSSALGLALQNNQGGGGASREVTVNINPGGLLLTDDVGKWRRTLQDIASGLSWLEGQQGGLGYGTRK